MSMVKILSTKLISIFVIKRSTLNSSIWIHLFINRIRRCHISWFRYSRIYWGIYCISTTLYPLLFRFLCDFFRGFLRSLFCSFLCCFFCCLFDSCFSGFFCQLFSCCFLCEHGQM